MAKITDYTSLKSNFQTYLAYDDMSLMFDTFLGLAEAGFRRDIRIREMEAQVDFTIDSDSTEALPAGFLEIIDIFETGSGGGTLEYLPPQKFYTLKSARSGTGQPCFYTMIGDQLKFAPLVDSATRAYTMNYFKEFDALTESATTNALLTLAPDVYLCATLLQAQPYLADPQRGSEFESLYQKSIASLHASDSRARHRPRGQMYADGVTADGAFRI